MESRQYFASLSIGQWTYSLPSQAGNGTATATADISENDSSGYSGSLRLTLELSTAPYGQGGQYYTASDSYPLTSLTAGYHGQRTTTSSFDLSSVPNGTYYVLLVVSEFTGGNTYTIRDGSTANNTYIISGSTNPTGPTSTSSLSIGAWTYSLPSQSGNGTATATGDIIDNDSSGYSGSLRLTLELSTAPYGQGGVYYTASDSYPLTYLNAGYHGQRTTTSSFNIDSVPNGTYYVLLVVSEFTGNNTYTIRDGSTANNTYIISQSTTVPPTTSPPASPPPGGSTSGPSIAVTSVSGLSGSYLGGKKVSGSVRLTNQGDYTAIGSTEVDLFISSSSTLGADASPFTTIPTGFLNLKPGASKNLKFSSILPSGLPAADYYVVANSDPNDLLGENPSLSRITSVTSTIHIAPPSVDLSVGLAPNAFVGGTLAAGKPIFLPLVLSNAGNVAAATTIAFTLSQQAAGSQNATVLSLPMSVHLAPGKSKRIRVRVILPSGTYQLIGSITDTGISIPDTNTADKSFTTQTIFAG